MRTAYTVLATILVCACTAHAAEDFAEAVERITPSVASIISTSAPDEAGQLTCVTTGVVVSADGLILAPYDGTAGFETITVRLHDGSAHSAAVRGFDALSGLALLKIDAAGLTPAEFADSSKLRVGQWVVSVGNQFGIERKSSPSFSVGIVGGLECSVPYAGAYYDHLIKTDAAMNAGCVGGPLIDRAGQVVGINIAICSITGAWQGVGYAVPSNLVSPAIENLNGGTKIERGWLGVSIDHDNGVRVSTVGKGTPAEKAGLRKGDTITAYNGKAVRDSLELVDLVASTAPGSTAVITITRDGRKQDVAVQVGSRPAGFARSPVDWKPDDQQNEPFRAIVEKINSGLRRSLEGDLDEARDKLKGIIKQYIATLKDPALIDKYKRALESFADIELRIVSPRQLEQLREENRDLRRRVEELEKLLKNK